MSTLKGPELTEGERSFTFRRNVYAIIWMQHKVNFSGDLLSRTHWTGLRERVVYV